MGLKLRLQWFDKTTELGIGKELSKDAGDDYSALNLLRLSVEKDINHGVFEVRENWLSIIQPYFHHEINLLENDYFLAQANACEIFKSASCNNPSQADSRGIPFL